MKKRCKLINNNNGFTLVEAIVTIVVFAIVVVPITTVYMGTFNDSANNEKILLANQTGQLFIENMKAKTYDEIMIDYYGDVDYPMATPDTALTTYEVPLVNGHGKANVPEVPKGYKVVAKLHRGKFGTGVYVRPEVKEIAAANVEIKITNYIDTPVKKVTYEIGGSSYTYETSLGNLTIDYSKDSKKLEVSDPTGIVYTSPAITDDKPVVNLIVNVSCDARIDITTDAGGGTEYYINQYEVADLDPKPQIYTSSPYPDNIKRTVESLGSASSVGSIAKVKSDYVVYELEVAVLDGVTDDEIIRLNSTITE